MAIKVLMLVLFFGMMLAVGFYCRRSTNDVNGFVLGNRNVGPWLSAFAYGTSYFSAVIFVGYAGQFGFKYGIASTWIGLGNAFLGSLLAWVVLGRRTRIMTHHYDSATMPDFFGKRFENKSLKIVASLIVFIFLIPYTASLYNGLSRIFGMAFNVDYTLCIVLMAVLTGIYVIAGGYMATVVNDFIQGIVMILGIIATIAVILRNNGGFMAAMTKLAEVNDPAVSTTPGVFASFFGPDPFSLFCVILLTSLGTWGLPQMVQKFYAIKSEKAITQGTIISTFFAVIVAGGSYFMGGFGRLYSDQIDVAKEGYDVIVPTIMTHFPDFLIGLVVILVLSASMSTLSALVMASSSTLTLDFIKEKIMPDMDDAKQVLIMRIFIVLFILISMVIAVVQHKSNITFIAQLMGISWGALGGAFLAPFLYGLYLKNTSKIAVWVCFITGPSVMVLNMLFRKSFPVWLQSPINAGAATMLLGLVIVPFISFFRRKKPTSLVDAAFASYEKKVYVPVKEDLGENELNGNE